MNDIVIAYLLVIGMTIAVLIKFFLYRERVHRRQTGTLLLDLNEGALTGSFQIDQVFTQLELFLETEINGSFLENTIVKIHLELKGPVNRTGTAVINNNPHRQQSIWNPGMHRYDLGQLPKGSYTLSVRVVGERFRLKQLQLRGQTTKHWADAWVDERLMGWEKTTSDI